MTPQERCQKELNRLQALGTLDAIAADLKTRGIRGHRGDPGRCPLAVDLTEVTGTKWRVGITQTWPAGGISESEYVRLPPLVMDFRRAVDMYQYRELLRNGLS